MHICCYFPHSDILNRSLLTESIPYVFSEVFKLTRITLVIETESNNKTKSPQQQHFIIPESTSLNFL